MTNLNVLIIGNSESKFLQNILRSNYLNKLYANFEHENAISIQFNTFKELAIKCKSLKIDIVFVEDEKYILQGIADVLKVNFVNCIVINSFWTQLILSNKFAKNMLSKYEINIPEEVIYPDKFPVVYRADRFSSFVNSIEEVIEIKKKLFKFSPVISKTAFLEKYIDGDEFILSSIFDGKNLITFPADGIGINLVKEYNDKLQKMFLSENSNFIGYINSDVIVNNEGELYNVGFNLEFPHINLDMLFVSQLAIYQKLNEINMYRQ